VLPEVSRYGTFAVELSGRRIDNMLPGRQGRLLFAYLALSRLQPLPTIDVTTIPQGYRGTR
jgi:hypothetical protein